MIKLKSLLSERIVLNPDALAKLSKPAAEPSSAATLQPGEIKDKDKDKKRDKDVPPELDLGPLQEALDTAVIPKADRQNVAFMSGLKLGVQDKIANRKSDLQGYPEDFIRGYKVVKIPGVWDRFNDRLTNWAAALGSSRLR